MTRKNDAGQSDVIGILLILLGAVLALAALSGLSSINAGGPGHMNTVAVLGGLATLLVVLGLKA